MIIQIWSTSKSAMELQGQALKSRVRKELHHTNKEEVRRLILIWLKDGGNSNLPLFLLVFPNSEARKVEILAFSSIKGLFVRGIHAKFCIPNLFQSPDIGQNLDCGVSDFRISGQSFVLTPEPVKRLTWKTWPEKRDEYVVPPNYNFLVIF